MSSVLLSKINYRLSELLPVAGHSHLDEAVASALLAPGKRLRPLVMHALAQDLALDNLAVMDLSCSIEMLHCASLILDDLPYMDNAQFRRGQLTTHIQFGESTAVLAAFSLLNQAHFFVTDIELTQPNQRKTLNTLFRDTVSQLVSGQQFDLENGLNNTDDSNKPCNTVQLNYLKTGSLFVACAESVGILANLCQSDLANLHNFAGEFGNAYQLLDDLNDHVGSVPSLGKDIAQDEDKNTLLNQYGIQQSRILMERHLSQAQECLKLIQPNWQMTEQYLKQLSGLLHA